MDTNAISKFQETKITMRNISYSIVHMSPLWRRWTLSAKNTRNQKYTRDLLPSTHHFGTWTSNFCDEFQASDRDEQTPNARNGGLGVNAFMIHPDPRRATAGLAASKNTERGNCFIVRSIYARVELQSGQCFETCNDVRLCDGCWY